MVPVHAHPGRWIWVPIDQDDICQERALAELEGRDPDAAAKEWIRREKYWYRFHVSFPYGDQDYVDSWILKFYAAIPTVAKPNRSEDSLAKRREYVRNWWRTNGKEYRRKRISLPGSVRWERR